MTIERYHNVSKFTNIIFKSHLTNVLRFTRILFSNFSLKTMHGSPGLWYLKFVSCISNEIKKIIKLSVKYIDSLVNQNLRYSQYFCNSLTYYFFKTRLFQIHLYSIYTCIWYIHMYTVYSVRYSYT